MDGVLSINKPLGPTSFHIVSRVKRAAGQKRVGHADTLDPNASGVLLVCLGNATRVVEYLMDWGKGYRATACFGVETSTEDADGSVLHSADASHITREMLESVLPKFTGHILQIPPMVSALHHNGRRLYDLAREGQVVERAPRPVEIYSIKLLDFQPGEHPSAVLDVECSKGTYIRTLCADIGKALGCGGHMSSLVRTHVGRFHVEDAVSMEAVEEKSSEGRFSDLLYTVDEVLADVPCVTVMEEDVFRVVNGVSVPIEDSDALPGAERPVRIHAPGGNFLAIGKILREPGGAILLRPEKVFANS